MKKRNWFQRPFASFCVLCGLVVLSVYVIAAFEGRRNDGGEINYRVVMRHYGVDAKEMESAAAIPLEDALSAITGITRMITVSENGQVRAFVSFRNAGRKFSSGDDEYFDAVREAAQRVYETLPLSAQRPEISSQGDSRIPFWTAAVYASSNGKEYADAELLEKIIKPALRNIDGVAEVEIAGAGIKEIIVDLDQEKTASFGLVPGNISVVLAENDALFPGGFVRYGDIEIPLYADGRRADLTALGETLIPFDLPGGISRGAVKLESIAEIREQERQPDTLSRLNGKKTAVISVTSASGADSRVLSKRIAAEMENFSHLPLEFHVLEDRGAGEAASFRSVFAAALEASFLVALAAALLGRGKQGGLINGLICAGAIAFIAVLAAAFLKTAGFPLNRKFLAGLAAGIGGAADAVILSAEAFGGENPSKAAALLKNVWPPLVSGAVTTAAALLPLMTLSSSGDIIIIANALCSVSVVSVLTALVLLPPFFLIKKSFFKQRAGFFSGACRQPDLPRRKSFVRERFYGFLKMMKGYFSRFIDGSIRFCISRPLAAPAFSLFISAAAVVSVILAGTDTAGEIPDDSVYVRIEFEGGFLKEEADRLLASWAVNLKKNPAVINVQTGARTGAGYSIVTFDPRKYDAGEMRNIIRSKEIPGAFIYIPEPSRGDRTWTISVTGDISEKCAELCETAASLCAGAGNAELPFIKETVLNFKQGGPRLSLVPRRETLAQGQIPFLSAAETVRRGLYGPVAYKRNGAAGETDVRVKFAPRNNTVFTEPDIYRMPLALADGSGTMYIGSLVNPEKTNDASSIEHKNRRRAASFSIRTEPGDPRYFRYKIMGLLKNMELPPGYKIEFDPEAVQRAEALSGKLVNFLWAVIFCYMIIAAAEESFILPLIVLSSVLPSLALPVMVLSFSGISLNTAAACALIAVSGMTVNASLISAEELWRLERKMRRYSFAGKTDESFFRGVKKRFPAFMATSGTTIIGALPFLFLKETNNELVRTLGMVTALGVAASFFCSITLVPSLIKVYFRTTEKIKRRQYHE